MTNISKAAETAKKVVIAGSSWIGTECASSLKGKYPEMEITMTLSGQVPLEPVLGTDIGLIYKNVHEVKGNVFKTGVRVKGICKKEDGSVDYVELSNGEKLSADLVIMGTGVLPCTQFLKDSGVELNPKGGVVCNEFLQTSDKDIYAAGDIVEYPYAPTGTRIRTEHWVVA